LEENLGHDQWVASSYILTETAWFRSYGGGRAIACMCQVMLADEADSWEKKERRESEDMANA
jgi:hypothetical protein